MTHGPRWRSRFALAIGVALLSLGSSACIQKEPVVAPVIIPESPPPPAHVQGDGADRDPRPREAKKLPFGAGDDVDVEWHGSWYPAKVLSASKDDQGGPAFKIHYDGYGSDWDEVVGMDRVRAREAREPEPQEARDNDPGF